MSATAVRRLPPVAEVAVATMVLVIVGGIYLASSLPKQAALGPAVGLLAASGVLLAWNVLTLRRLRPFAWGTFFLVARWSLVGYIVIAGMLEYVFVRDHVRGSLLAVLTLMLTVYAVNIPLLLGFSVARYQSPAGD